MRRLLITLAVAVSMFLQTAVPARAGDRLICASTTSTQNSGLFDWLLPKFKADSGIEVHVIAAGTGAALEMGKRGDADVVFVHAKGLELALVKEGYFVSRRDVMYNDFVIVGPKDDPAGIRAAINISEALSKIERALGPFVSRGDNSGTHKKELSLWAKVDLVPAGLKKESWYMEVGQGMSKTTRIASEKQAYTLTDRGTWLAKMDTLDLEILFEGDPELFNQYGVMAVNPARNPHINHKDAKAFIEWLTSEKGQQAIDDFRSIKGDRLFKSNYK